MKRVVVFSSFIYDVLKKFLFLLILLTLSCGLLQADEKKGVVFATTEWNFGSIEAENGPVSYTFRMKNFGKECVTIGNLVPSCYCVVPKMSDKVLSPGEEGELELILHPTGTSGTTYRTLEVYDSEGGLLATLSVYAEVKSANNGLQQDYPIVLDKALWANRESLTFGYLYWGEETEQFIGIANPSSEDVRLEVTVEGTADAPIALHYPRQLKQGEQAEICVIYSVPEDYGKYTSFDNQLVLSIDGKRVDRSIATNCIVMREISKSGLTPSLWSAPSRAKMERGFFSKQYQGEITIGNSGKAPLKIVGIKSTTKTNLKAGTVIQPGETLVVEVESSLPDARIELFTNDPARPYKELLYTNNQK